MQAFSRVNCSWASEVAPPVLSLPQKNCLVREDLRIAGALLFVSIPMYSLTI